MAKIRIAVNHLCNDMIIGEDVYNKSGVVLVAQGSIVTDAVSYTHLRKQAHVRSWPWKESQRISVRQAVLQD